MKRRIGTLALALGMAASVPFFGASAAHAQMSFNDPAVMANTDGLATLMPCGVYTCFNLSNAAFVGFLDNENLIQTGPFSSAVVHETGVIRFINHFGALNSCARATLNTTLSYAVPNPAPGHTSSSINYFQATGSLCVYNDGPDGSTAEPDLLFGSFSYRGGAFGGGGKIEFTIDTDTNILTTGIPRVNEYFNDYNGGVAENAEF